MADGVPRRQRTAKRVSFGAPPGAAPAEKRPRGAEHGAFERVAGTRVETRFGGGRGGGRLWPCRVADARDAARLAGEVPQALRGVDAVLLQMYGESKDAPCFVWRSPTEVRLFDVVEASKRLASLEEQTPRKASPLCLPTSPVSAKENAKLKAALKEALQEARDATVCLRCGRPGDAADRLVLCGSWGEVCAHGVHLRCIGVKRIPPSHASWFCRDPCPLGVVRPVAAPQPQPPPPPQQQQQPPPHAPSTPADTKSKNLRLARELSEEQEGRRRDELAHRDALQRARRECESEVRRVRAENEQRVTHLEHELAAAQARLPG